METGARGLRRLVDRVCLAAIVALLAATPFYMARASRMTLNPDPFIYGQVAEDLLAGKRLYTEVRLDKGPLLPFLYAIPQLIVPGSCRAQAFFLGLWIDLSALMFWWTLRRDRVAALACVTVLTLIPLTHWDFAWLSSEHLTNVLVAGNLLLGCAIFRRGVTLAWCVAAGALTCLALNTRQPTVLSGAVPAAAIVLAAVPWRRKLTSLAAAALGMIVTEALVLAVVSRVSDVSTYLHFIFVHPFAYSSIGGRGDAWALLTSLLRSTPGTLALLAFGLALLTRFRVLAALALLAGVAVLVAPSRNFPHYLVSFLPFLALFVALGLAESRLARPWLQLLYVGVAAGMLLPEARAYLWTTGENANVASYERVAQAVDRLAPPGATLAVCGRMPCEAITYASRVPPANFIWVLWELNPPESNVLPDDHRAERVFAEYLERPPTMLVVWGPYYQSALAAGEGQLPNQVRLVKLLLERHGYEPRVVVDDYVIAVLRPAGT